ncbi:MAG: hypothetical protein WC365_10255 [Candidatus Babeliales bacterium]|jgi:hypothetical protein
MDNDLENLLEQHYTEKAIAIAPCKICQELRELKALINNKPKQLISSDKK